MKNRQIGNRSVNNVINYLTPKGYLVDKVELGGKFTKSKDLFSSETFGGFDLVALSFDRIKFIQVKTNSRAKHQQYLDFSKKYTSSNKSLRIEQWVWMKKSIKKKSGFVIYIYHNNNDFTKIDLRDYHKKYKHLNNTK